jgi:hypothetical protein
VQGFCKRGEVPKHCSEFEQLTTYKCRYEKDKHMVRVFKNINNTVLIPWSKVDMFDNANNGKYFVIESLEGEQIPDFEYKIL